MKRPLLLSAALLGFGLLRLPMEQGLAREYRDLRFHGGKLDLELREKIGHFGFVAALSGFRSVVADFLFLQAHAAWEKTDWSRLLLLLRQATSLQPASEMFWDIAAWHMAWNASAAARRDPENPRLADRLRRQREFYHLGRDFLERGLRYNPRSARLWEALGRLYRDKFQDHMRASEAFLHASTLPGASSYLERFSAYELAQVRGQEHSAYARLLKLYRRGARERAPTLIARLKSLEEKLNVPADQRIPDPAPGRARP